MIVPINSELGSLGVYLTGAGSDGAQQADELLSLGGHRSGTEAGQPDGIVSAGCPALIVANIYGAPGPVALTVDSAGNVTLDDGEGQASGVLASGASGILATDAAALRLTREPGLPHVGNCTARPVVRLNNVIGGRDLDNAERVLGSEHYCAIAVRNDSAAGISGVQARPVSSLLAVAVETPTVNAIQVIADHETAPTGVTWHGDVEAWQSLATSLSAGEWRGLWLRRTTPADMDPTPGATIGVELQWVSNGVTYQRTLLGQFRARRDGSRVLCWVTEDGSTPDPTTEPTDIASEMDFVLPIEPPETGLKTIRALARIENSYGLQSLDWFVREITVNSDGDVVTPPPQYEASQFGIYEISRGMVSVTAGYKPSAEPVDVRADSWVFYVGTAGDYLDEPVTEEMPVQDGDVSTVRHFGPFNAGAEIVVLVRVKRGDVHSENDATKSLVMSPAPGAVDLLLSAATEGIPQPTVISVPPVEGDTIVIMGNDITIQTNLFEIRMPDGTLMFEMPQNGDAKTYGDWGLV